MAATVEEQDNNKGAAQDIKSARFVFRSVGWQGYSDDAPRLRPSTSQTLNPASLKKENRTKMRPARTIAFHRYTMMEAFGLKTNSALFRFAVKEG